MSVFDFFSTTGPPRGEILDSQNIPEALLGCHLFSELTELQLDRVRRHSHLIDMVEGESLFFQGDEAVSFYLVLSGRMFRQTARRKLSKSWNREQPSPRR
jgi:hypothetical protein